MILFRKVKFIGTLLTVVMLFLLVVPSANAYVYNKDGYPSATYDLDFGYSRYNDTWTKRIAAAVANWNVTNTPVWITHSSSSINKMYADNYADGWYGLYIPSKNASGRVTSFMIKLNARTIGADASNWDHFIESTTVHEIGHSLKLDHTSGTAIMNPNRNRNNMYTPQTDDINGVNAYY